MRRTRSTRITSDAFAATKVALNAIQASADAFPPLKSAVSAVIKAKSNRKGCEHIAKRSAQLVQDIWRQTKDFGVALPAEVEGSVVQIGELFIEIEKFFEELTKDNLWERLARQDRNKSQINLELGAHRLHLELAAAEQKRHTDVLAVSRMSESERVQLLTQIRGDVHMGKHAATCAVFFLDHPTNIIAFMRSKVMDYFYQNPFVACILLSHRVLGPEPRYARGYGDVAFVAYHVVFSLIRQLITVMLAPASGATSG
ncbi:hypothetical protein B0H13DRAFT_2664284 [Mycena leptocephala]|nr:hypothetical protein B0H13DRAFT_2664284 [Mycena leptocephala]